VFKLVVPLFDSRHPDVLIVIW